MLPCLVAALLAQLLALQVLLLPGTQPVALAVLALQKLARPLMAALVVVVASVRKRPWLWPVPLLGATVPDLGKRQCKRRG